MEFVDYADLEMDYLSLKEKMRLSYTEDNLVILCNDCHIHGQHFMDNFTEGRLEYEEVIDDNNAIKFKRGYEVNNLFKNIKTERGWYTAEQKMNLNWRYL